MNARNSDLLQGRLTGAIKSGETPYQASRHALRSLDIEGDGDAGLDEVRLMQRGLVAFVKDLEELKSVAQEVVKRATAAVR
jgi:hypothetical protein